MVKNILKPHGGSLSPPFPHLAPARLRVWVMKGWSSKPAKTWRCFQPLMCCLVWNPWDEGDLSARLVGCNQTIGPSDWTTVFNQLVRMTWFFMVELEDGVKLVDHGGCLQLVSAKNQQDEHQLSSPWLLSFRHETGIKRWSFSSSRSVCNCWASSNLQWLEHQAFWPGLSSTSI